jgi:hypothetical protein
MPVLLAHSRYILIGILNNALKFSNKFVIKFSVHGSWWESQINTYWSSFEKVSQQDAHCHAIQILGLRCSLVDVNDNLWT